MRGLNECMCMDGDLPCPRHDAPPCQCKNAAEAWCHNPTRDCDREATARYWVGDEEEPIAACDECALSLEGEIV